MDLRIDKSQVHSWLDKLVWVMKFIGLEDFSCEHVNFAVTIFVKINLIDVILVVICYLESVGELCVIRLFDIIISQLE